MQDIGPKLSFKTTKKKKKNTITIQTQKLLREKNDNIITYKFKIYAQNQVVKLAKETLTHPSKKTKQSRWRMKKKSSFKTTPKKNTITIQTQKIQRAKMWQHNHP